MLEDIPFPILMLASVVSLVIGSFLGVLAERLPVNRSPVFGRSTCAACGAVLAPIDLIPLFSWLWWRGKCRRCGVAIGAFYPLIELAALGVAVWAWLVVPMGWTLVVTCLLGWALLTLALIDWRHFILPDAITLSLIPLGLLASFVVDREFVLDHLIGAAAGYCFVVLIAFIYRLWRGQEGIGRGDAKLLAAAGAWVTWQGLSSVVLYASVLALIGVAIQSLAGREVSATHKVAFGSYLCVAIWLVWLYGPLVLLGRM